MSTDHTQQARLSLDLLRTQVDAGFSHLKALCSENGRLDPGIIGPATTSQLRTCFLRRRFRSL